MREPRQCLIERRLRSVGEGERGRARFACTRFVAELRASETSRDPRLEVIEVAADANRVRAIRERNRPLGLAGGGEHHGLDPAAGDEECVGVVPGGIELCERALDVAALQQGSAHADPLLLGPDALLIAPRVEPGLVLALCTFGVTDV